MKNIIGINRTDSGQANRFLNQSQANLGRCLLSNNTVATIDMSSVIDY